MHNKFSLLLLIASVTLTGCSQETTEVAQSVEKPAVSEAAKVLPKPQTVKYKEGVDYRIVTGIDTEGAKEPFIVEYFWLGCPHCQKLEAPLHQFMDANPNFEVLKKPGAFSARWKMDARIFYGLKKLGKLDQLDGLFDQYRDKPLPSKTSIGSFLQSIDIEPNGFYEMIDSSPEITERLEKNNTEMQSNKINGVPGIVVNGKYLVTSKDGDLFELVKYLGNI